LIVIEAALTAVWSTTASAWGVEPTSMGGVFRLVGSAGRVRSGIRISHLKRDVVMAQRWQHRGP